MLPNPGVPIDPPTDEVGDDLEEESIEPTKISMKWCFRAKRDAESLGEMLRSYESCQEVNRYVQRLVVMIMGQERCSEI